MAVLFVGLCFAGLGIKTPAAAGTRGRKTSDVIDSATFCRLGSAGGHGVAAATATAQLPTDGSDAAESALEVLQQSFSLLQSIVHAHGGVIKELSVDDKGTVRYLDVLQWVLRVVAYFFLVMFRGK